MYIENARIILVFLIFCNFLFYFDKTALSASIIEIKQALHLDPVQIGSLGAVLMGGYMLFSPIFAYVEKYTETTYIIAIGLILYSVASFGVGVSIEYLTLVIGRLIIGIGEAAYAPIASAYVDTLAPNKDRTTWLAVYSLGSALGAAGGYIIAGILATRYSWRFTFLGESTAMVFMFFICLMIKNRPKASTQQSGIYEGDTTPEGNQGVFPIAKKYTILELSVYLLKNKLYTFVLLGSSLMNFSTSALAFWAPTYITKLLDMPLDRVSLGIGVITIVTGISGIMIGGVIVDRYGTENKAKNIRVSLYFIVSVISAMLPIMTITFLSTNPYMFFTFLAVTEFMIFSVITPIGSLLMKIVEEEHKTFAVSMQVFVSHLIGDFPSPIIIGFLIQQYTIESAMFALIFSLICVDLFFAAALLYSLDKKNLL